MAIRVFYVKQHIFKRRLPVEISIWQYLTWLFVITFVFVGAIFSPCVWCLKYLWTHEEKKAKHKGLCANWAEIFAKIERVINWAKFGYKMLNRFFSGNKNVILRKRERERDRDRVRDRSNCAILLWLWFCFCCCANVIVVLVLFQLASAFDIIDVTILMYIMYFV